MAKTIPPPAATSLSSHYHPPRHNLAHSASSLPPRQANIQGTRPSSTVLALLAAVAASSTGVDGRPLRADSSPLDFLCPLFGSDSPDCPSTSQIKPDNNDVDPAVYYLSPTPTRKRRPRSVTGSVPAKYSQGADGIWRKESSWSLYGSTHCEVCAVFLELGPRLIGCWASAKNFPRLRRQLQRSTTR